MNKIRIIGLVILIIGIIIMFSFENEVTDFISALLLGLGFGLLIIGKVRKSVK